MRLGAHLPLADFGEGSLTAAGLSTYARAARELGYSTVAANDHLVWRLPWLDGPTALASVASAAGDMTLATSISLPVVRHPVVLAKSLVTLAVLAGGRVVAGLGPGSSRADYDAVGGDFDHRWSRFDDALRIVRALVRGEPAPAVPSYPAAPRLSPLANQPPEVWFGSWGSDRRLAAMAAVADGWFFSAYNATPGQFAEARKRLDGHLRDAGRDPAGFPDAVATAWRYVTDHPAEAENIRSTVLAPALGRDPEQLAHLPIGTAEHCAEAIAGYAAAGAQELLVWPVRGRIEQLERCWTAVQSLR